MTACGVGVGVHYLSIPEHPVYQEKFAWQPEDYPNAMRIGRQTVSLPLSAKLTDAEVSRVIEAVHVALNVESRGQKSEVRSSRSEDPNQPSERFGSLQERVLAFDESV
jgi:hypothetical protein